MQFMKNMRDKNIILELLEICIKRIKIQYFKKSKTD